jgi:hypothetical protein
MAESDRTRGTKTGGGGRISFDLTAQQWVVAFLIGIATVLAAFFGWRAAAIGSTAAFDDRQSISESIKVERQSIDIALEVVADTREYTRYLANYALAAELDNQADGLERSGDDAAAAETRQEAQLLRRAATERAADAGVFGRFTIEDDLERPSPTPRPYSLEERITAETAAATTGLDSPGQLDPDGWAADSEEIRERIQGLARWSFILLVAVLLFTAGQVFSQRRPAFYTLMAAGVIVLLVGAIGGFSADFFA